MRSSSAAASASGPSRSSSSSVPRISTNAIATCRCSGSAGSPRSSRVYAAGSSSDRSTPDGSKNGGTISGTSGLLREQHDAVAALAQQARARRAARVAALSAISPARAIASVCDARRRVGAGDDQLAVDAADEEEVEHARVHADRHPQPHGPGRGRAPSHARKAFLHADRGCGRALRVVLAAEEQQDGVAAELQEVGLLRVGARGSARRTRHRRRLRSPPRPRARAWRGPRSGR